VQNVKKDVVLTEDQKQTVSMKNKVKLIEAANEARRQAERQKEVCIQFDDEFRLPAENDSEFFYLTQG